jgi:hypothetical protein
MLATGAGDSIGVSGAAVDTAGGVGDGETGFGGDG